MRITKILLKNDFPPLSSKRSVLFSRNYSGGFLYQDHHSIKDKERIASFIQSKKAEFQLSLLHKTLVKSSDRNVIKPKKKHNENLKQQREREKKQLQYQHYQSLNCLFRELLYLIIHQPMDEERSQKKVTKIAEQFENLQKWFCNAKNQELNIYFSHRFKVDISKQSNILNVRLNKGGLDNPKLSTAIKPNSMTNDNSAQSSAINLSFDLIAELKQALLSGWNAQIERFLPQYQQWVKQSIQQKSDRLAQSIINNRLDYQAESDSSSNRKKTLRQWSELLFQQHQINFSQLETDFNLKELKRNWANVIEQCQKYTQADIDKITNSAHKKPAEQKEKLRQKLGTPKNPFEFKRALKQALQQHIAPLTSKYQDNPQLQQYSNEVSKYLMHYFPLKSSARHLPEYTQAFDDYAQYYCCSDSVQKIIQNQITNAVMQYIFQAGKAAYYQLAEKADSTQLEQIKIKEAFTLQWINACGFAASNLRNCLNPHATSDVLGKTYLSKQIKICLNIEANRETSIKKLVDFFALPVRSHEENIVDNRKSLENYLSIPEHYQKFLWGVRGAIQQIRNEIIHFQPDALDKIFKLTEFEYPYPDKQGKATWCSDKKQVGSLAGLFQQSLLLLPDYFAEKVKSAGLLSYYPLETVMAHFDKWSLKSKPLSFIPRFRKIFNLIERYLQDKNNWLDFSDNYFFVRCKFTITNDKLADTSAEQAKYNALEWIYRQQFSYHFLKDDKLFIATVNQLLERSQKLADQQAQQRSNGKVRTRYNNAFAEIPLFEQWEQSLNPNEGGGPKEYLIYIQSLLIQEENKKREEGKLAESDTGHFQRFIYLLFALGFNQYLSDQDESYAFITNPTPQFMGSRAEQTEALNDAEQAYCNKLRSHQFGLLNLNELQDSHVAFWTLCKLLDAKHLNELDNQLSKWAQAHRKNKVVQSNSEVIQIQQEIIRIALLSNSQVTPFTQQQRQQTIPAPLGCYIQDGAFICADSPYRCNESKDPFTIALKNVELTQRYATMHRLSQFFENNPKWRVTEGDIQQEKQLSATVSYKIQRKQQLRDIWLQNKELSKKECEEYHDCCQSIDNYQWLNNKITLVHVKRLHNLLLDILGRLAGFVNLYERDYQFLNEVINLRCAHQVGIVGYKMPSQILNSLAKANGEELKLKLKSLTAQSITSFDITAITTELKHKQQLLTGSLNYLNFEKITHRNYLAHFNYLTQTQTQTKLSASLLDLIAKTRQLVSHDRKLKNSVIKSIISLFEQYNICLKFKPLYSVEHQLIIDREKTHPRIIDHLATEQRGKKKAIYQQNAVHKDFCEMAIELLEMR